ncbi:MAG: VWA domain-containing protein [Planctomycetaceae bacterium]|jgi:uncharacterized membrane protein/uncharacterized protein YegL|nr:VWA domain-containing protein [Planctomycetaceae bacterium]
MQFEFSRPYCLLLLLLISLLWRYWRCLVRFSFLQRAAALVVRFSILILLVFSAAGFTFLLPSNEAMLVVLVDNSLSIDDDARNFADNYIKHIEAFARNRPVVVVPFAGKTNADADTTRETTDIATALVTAAALVPAGYVPEILLLSDGNETVGDSLTTALQLNIPVHTFPLYSHSKPEIELYKLNVPPNARASEPFNVDVVVRSNHDCEAVVSLFRDDYKVGEQTINIRSHINNDKGEYTAYYDNVLTFQQTAGDERQITLFAAVSTANDTFTENNTATSVVSIDGKPRVLLLEGEQRSVREFTAAMKEQGINVDVRPAEGCPKTLDEFDKYDAIMFSDVPASSLSYSQMDLLRHYVRDLGGGFVMLGGEQSFGLGGYYKTLVEEALPVRCDFNKQREKPSLAICLLIDRSGSMGGEKIAMSKEAAKATVELLTPRDFISVVTFDHQCTVVVPIQSASSTSVINSSIATIEAAGGTNIYPSLEIAYEQLTKSSAKIKHVILLTDGYSEQTGDYAAAVRKLTSAQITVSTVGIGSADNKLLEQIASLGHGKHYVVENPQTIPQIFAKETIEANKSAIDETPFVPILVTPNETVTGVDLSNAPPLLGFVSTRPKETSQTVLATETGEPLLTFWRYDLGVTAAFSSDVKSRWAAEWLTWNDFAKLWSQVLRYTMKKIQTRGTNVELTQNDGRLQVTIDIVDDTENFINNATGSITVIRPNLTQEQVELKAAAPGRYAADITTSELGSYNIRFEVKGGDKLLLSQNRSVTIGHPKELNLTPTNEALLKNLSESTKAVYKPNPNQLLTQTKTTHHPRPVWKYLLTIAAIMLVIDVLLGRIKIL